MWIVNQDGFFSIVYKDCHKDDILVRARVKDDLVNLLLKMNLNPDYILTNVGTDYPFRANVPRNALAWYFVKYIKDMKYKSFKSSVPKMSKKRKSVYMNVWGNLIDLEKEE